VLESPDGVFQQSLRSGATDETIVRGLLLLGEAQLARTNFNGVEAALQSLSGMTQNPDLKWNRLFLQARLQRAQGRLEDALQTATNLVLSVNSTNRAAGVVFAGETFEQLNRLDSAIAEYRENLTASAPLQYRRHALLRIAELSLVLDNAAEAMKTLQDFLSQFPGDSASDAALLALGELELEQHLSGARTNQVPATNNFCERARAHFDKLLREYPNSSLAGKALLNKGWCLWSDGNYGASEAAFSQAVSRLPLSEDQAVARFKWADSQFMRTNFSGALNNYHFVTAYYSSVPAVKDHLLEPALYQTTRAALNVDDLQAATNALHKILEWYPDGFAGDRCLLYVGQAFSRLGDTGRARQLFADVEARAPVAALLPEVRLAVARTYERETNWQAAITNYDAWILTYTNHAELPRAEFSRAWDYYQAGQQTNALIQFTNFVAHFPASEFTPMAQMWIGDHYFNERNFPDAELNYQLVEKSGRPASPLTYQAKMMAGRAAVARLSYPQAIQYYFSDLATNMACPPDLRAQAQFAWGDALVSRQSTNRVQDLKEAILRFQEITNSDLVVPALGRIGECYLLLAGTTNVQYFTLASNEFQQVLNSTNASLNARYNAKIELARMITERLVPLETDDEQKIALLKQGLTYYLEVFFDEGSPEDDRQSELILIARAGLQAGRWAEELKLWRQAAGIYRRLGDLIPNLRPDLAEKIAKAESH
jgi:TolA-binding protein